MKFDHEKGFEIHLVFLSLETSTKKRETTIRIRRWTNAGGTTRNYGLAMLYPIQGRINPSIRVVVSNLKYEVEKATLAELGNIVKYLLDDMSSNDLIILNRL